MCDTIDSNLARLVLSVSRMTIHNGPGIRTLILFKECSLRCLWCSTPESQKGQPEIAFRRDKCIRCDRCISACSLKAIALRDETIHIDRALCNGCGMCVEVCYSEALILLGKRRTVRELVQEVKKDQVFYRHSRGGVTLSGGEPLLNPGFTVELLRTLKTEGISAGVDTSGHVPWANVEPVLPYVDFFLWDIKHMNPQRHKELTGASNELILDNLRGVSERKVPVYVRVPVMPGYNDSEENVAATCEFSRGLPTLVEIDLLPLHHLGKARYDSLDRCYLIADLHLIPDATVKDLKARVESYGLKACVIN
jgi:pyruvate formate lyase activating enzyme